MIRVCIDRDFDAWRAAARRLLARETPPEAVVWAETASIDPMLPLPASDLPTEEPAEVASPVAVPAGFVEIARRVACFRDDGRWGLLYRVIWRLTHGERTLLEVVVDDDVHRLLMMERSVRRDRHKMTAFVRFRRTGGEDGTEHYVAWHRPDHFIVHLTAPFFARRFPNLNWSILTPDDSVSWDGQRLYFSPGAPASAAPQADDLEDLWRTYYANIFNPARVKLKAMKRELPVRHWPTLPETQLIPDLVRQAAARVEDMMAKTAKASTVAADGSKADCKATGSAADFLPERITLPQLREASKTCRGCELYCNATQTVFGEGPADATVMFVGEQPGDKEDRAGKPFVGPAGQMLDEVMQQAGIPRDEAYVTNAVKHFKWEPRGTRRLHCKPSAREVKACRPWLESEIAVVKPKMIVTLGATAAQSLLGPAFRLTQHRGEVQKTDWAPWLLATVHPSSLLRIPDEQSRHQAIDQFVDDLRIVARQLKSEKRRSSAS